MVDNYSLWESHDREQEKKLSRLPVCDFCGEPIQSERALKIGRELMCEICMADHMVWTEEEVS